MKRKLGFVVCLIFVIGLTVQAWAGPGVMLDNNAMTFDVPPVVESGRTLVPLRAIFEQLGASVEWDGKTQTVTATKGNTVVKLTVGSANAYKGNSLVKLDVPAKVISGRTMVPLRFVSEAMGAYVYWDGVTQTVYIFKEKPEFVTVARVIDGDTIELEDGLKVRLIGVNTPETHHPEKGVEPYGPEAAAFTKSLLENKKVRLEFDVEGKDKYGRTLAYVFMEDGTFVNAKLVAEGYAQIMTIPPNVKYQDIFLKLQQQARNADKGLWGIQEGNVQTGNGQVKTTGKYVGSMKSDKYHYPDCRWAKEISAENQIWFTDVKEAKEKGYKPCGVCNPPVE